MQVSKLIEALQRVVQVAGDVPVVLRELESDAETELKSLGVHIDAQTGDTGGNVTLEHAAASPSNPPSEAPAEPTAPAAG
jgi:hypothetical protein